MTQELIRYLMAAGLSKQQATSATAETLTNLDMKEDGKILIAEAKRQVEEMSSLLDELRRDYYELKQTMQNVSEVVLGIQEAQDQYGKITDDKAQNVVALYAALLSMNQKAGASPSESVTNAGYTMYAFLGGQAKREINYRNPSSENNNNVNRL